jgi:anti-sigma regulatory factor (Ser/Thr protein kinase)
VIAGSSERADALVPTFTHEALFYSGVTTQLEAVREFVSEGLSVGDGVLVMLSAPKIEWLSAALGPAARGVQLAATNGVRESPGTLVPQWRVFADSIRSGQSRRGVCEPGRSDIAGTSFLQCQIHELLHELGEASFWLLCTYDESLSDEVLEEARRSHQYVSSASEPTSIDHEYGRSGEPDCFGSDASWEAPGDAQRFVVTVESTGLARRALYEFALAFGMADSAAADCALAGHEVISNSLRHGGGEAHLSIWRDEESLVCQVTDSGHFGAPLARRIRPGQSGRSGRGLWITNQLCDLVQIRSVPEGTVVRLRVHR